MTSEATNSKNPARRKTGLVLSGGGARGAYQAGVLRAIAEICADLGIVYPFQIISGVSAGAVNAAFLAATCDNFLDATSRMSQMWSKMTADRVFRTDAFSAGRSGLRFITDATLGALYRKKLARSLLDTTPLKSFLEETIPFANIQTNLQQGCLQALAITAMNYSKATSITFVHGKSDHDMWSRSRRISQYDSITAAHVMGSSAIPLFFPPVQVGEDYFGDGCLRNTAPLSPAIHIGADRLLVISVRKPDALAAPAVGNESEGQNGRDIDPSLARVLGVILNALLLDAIDVDMERMSRINTTVDLVQGQQRSELSLHKVKYLWLQPSKDIGELAGDLFSELPRVIKYLIGGLGSSREASELTSYLLFDPQFCGTLVKNGYDDGHANRQRIVDFLLAES